MSFNKFVVRGKSVQDGTPTPENPITIRNVGDDINLLKNTAVSTSFNGIDYTVNEDGSVIINGTATSTSYIFVGNFTAKAGKKYILQGCPSGGASTGYMLTTNINGTNTDMDIGNGVSFTYSEDTEMTINLRVASGITVNNLVFKPKIHEGTKATAYSPYGYGSVEIEKVNKNRINLSKAISGRGCEVQINNNTINVIADGTIAPQVKIPCDLDSGTYYLHFERPANISDMNISFLDENGSKVNTTNYQSSQAITLTGNAKSMIINTSIETSSYTLLFEDLYINKGNIDLGYAPHQSETFIFPVAEPLHEGDYLADTIVNNRKTIVLNGTENWWAYSNYQGEGYCYQIEIEDLAIIPITSADYIHSLCSHFKNVYSVWGYTTSKIGTYSDHGTVARKYFITDKATLEEWKTYLAEQYANGTPVILEYELADPVTTEYTEEQQTIYNNILNSNTYKNITHISAKGEVKPDIEIVYCKDLETIQKQNDENYDKLANAIVALGGVI